LDFTPSDRVRFGPQRTFQLAECSQGAASPDCLQHKPKSTSLALAQAVSAAADGYTCDAVTAEAYQPELWCLNVSNTNLDPSQRLITHTQVHSRLFKCIYQIMTLYPDSAPMSFPILKHLSASRAAHEIIFQPAEMTLSLEEQRKVLLAFREELRAESLRHAR
ncbi:hypothetical protein F1880_008915, partial [Penicillium rolfsii]